jgi:hypothetical protein
MFLFLYALIQLLLIHIVWWRYPSSFFSVYLIRIDTQHWLSQTKKNRFSILRFFFDRFVYYRNHSHHTHMMENIVPFFVYVISTDTQHRIFDTKKNRFSYLGIFSIVLFYYRNHCHHAQMIGDIVLFLYFHY